MDSLYRFSYFFLSIGSPFHMSFSIFIMDMDKESLGPQLYEPGVKEYMYEVLNKCHENRVNIYMYVLNISVVVVFLGSVCIILLYCYKSKLTPAEEDKKRVRDQEYVLSKIRYYKEQQRVIDSRASITGLPVVDERPLY
jgi:hypothetical protein